MFDEEPNPGRERRSELTDKGEEEET